MVLTTALAGLAFEWVAFSDFNGAYADDLALLQVGGGGGSGATSVPPPNIVFLFDDSLSMHNLICEELTNRCCLSTSFLGCTATELSNGLAAQAAPNGASICKNTVLAGAVGVDRTGDGAGDTYQARYQSDGVTAQGTPYPIFDVRGSTANDDVFPAGATYTHTLHGAFTQRVLGVGSTAAQQIKTAIYDECDAIGDCQTRSRCIYSLRTQGYFQEPSGASCATGDPMGICSAPTGGKVGMACTNNGQCLSNVCRSSRCADCANASACSGTGNSCTNSTCNHYYCTYNGCQYPTDDNNFGGAAQAIVLGDFLNAYPPKSYGMIKAFKDTINNMAGDARLGISDFDDIGSGTIAVDIKPPCSQSTGTNCFDGDPATQCFNPSDANLLTYLDNGLDFNNFTPLAKALDNVGQYYTTSTGTDTPICNYSSITSCSTNNFVVLITDGLPNADATSPSGVPFVNGKISGFSDGYYENQSPDQFVDDVAKALTVIDHRTFTGNQTVATYTVSYGLTDPSNSALCAGILQTTAAAGSGRCLPAVSIAELRTALASIVTEIVTRARGFTAPAVPTTRYSSTSSLSSAIFRPSTTFPLWEGHIFGFTFCDENLDNACDCPDPFKVCILDANGNEIDYDDEGYLASTPFWDAQLCLSGDPNGGNNVPAVPMDQGNLTVGDTSESGCYLTAAQRRIYTAVDGADAGTAVACSSPDTSTGGCTSGDAKIDFTAANVDSVTAFATALAGATTTASKKVVNFFRGYDVDDLNGNGSTTDERSVDSFYVSGEVRDGWWKLGDIFHSVPNVVERPTGRGLGAWATTASYTAFAADHASRIKGILVGANDGMLHAFNAGEWDASADGGKGAYDNGTGEELWAFVSPEMLPKLKSLCDPSGSGCGIGNHKWLVDGSVMVRDIWTGGTAVKTDAANKVRWRTVAVYGHRDGGTTYVALDVTNIANPIYLWQFPQPGTSEAANQGKSWLDTFPAPASIGPLQVKTSGNVVYDRWVVLLSAGFDQNDRKGNVLYMLDAYSGAVLWSATNTGAGNDTDDMNYAFAATPVFYGKLGGSFPYIGGVVAADHGGQLWHIPTSTVPTDTSTPYSFTPQLVFRTVDPPIDTDEVGGDNDSLLDFAEYQSHPFFFAPTLTRHGSHIRAIIGTGDRDLLIPKGTLSPTDGSAGSACDVNGDCTNPLVCKNNRCSGCSVNGNCGGSNTCINTNCLHHYCSNSTCTVALDVTGMPTAVNDSICSDVQLLLAVNLDCVPGGGREACTVEDLQETNGTSMFATDADPGWYFELDPGEKVATPFEIFSGYAIYTTFLPTVACDAAQRMCSNAAKGEARLYARHYISGKGLDWDDDGTVENDELAVSLGEGVPTAPAVSVAVGGGAATPTFIGGGSEGNLVAKEMGGAMTELITEIMRFPVSRALHDALHQ